MLGHRPATSRRLRVELFPSSRVAATYGESTRQVTHLRILHGSRLPFLELKTFKIQLEGFGWLVLGLRPEGSYTHGLPSFGSSARWRARSKIFESSAPLGAPEKLALHCTELRIRV